MKLSLFILAAAVVALLAYIRLAPSDPERWHIDPTAAADPGPGGVLIPPRRYTLNISPRALIEKFDTIALQHPATMRLAGTVDGNHITYMVRSKWFGFPDYVTVKTIPTDTGGSTLAILSRLRFGQSDLGVNRARLDNWLAQLKMPPG